MKAPGAVEIKDATQRAKRKRDTAVGAEVMGLAILAFGLGMWHSWVGVAVFGLGVVLIGLGIELS